MWGAIIGDIVGSTFENENHRSPYFEMFRKDARFTDDTVCTAAVADILEKNWPSNLTHDNISDQLRLWCCTYLNRGFGSMFYQWIANAVNRPYNSYGNGALMRISPVARFALKKELSKAQALEIAEHITNVTHNHPQAINAVRCYISILYDLLSTPDLALTEKKELIRSTLNDFQFLEVKKIDKYRVEIEFDLTCNTSLAVACASILETDNFDDVLYQVVSVGGDSDTYAAIAGAMAEAIYGISEEKKQAIKPYFRAYDEDIIIAMEKLYSN